MNDINGGIMSSARDRRAASRLRSGEDDEANLPGGGIRSASDAASCDDDETATRLSSSASTVNACHPALASTPPAPPNAVGARRSPTGGVERISEKNSPPPSRSFAGDNDRRVNEHGRKPPKNGKPASSSWGTTGGAPMGGLASMSTDEVKPQKIALGHETLLSASSPRRKSDASNGKRSAKNNSFHTSEPRPIPKSSPKPESETRRHSQVSGRKWSNDSKAYRESSGLRARATKEEQATLSSSELFDSDQVSASTLDKGGSQRDKKTKAFRSSQDDAWRATERYGRLKVSGREEHKAQAENRRGEAPADLNVKTVQAGPQSMSKTSCQPWRQAVRSSRLARSKSAIHTTTAQTPCHESDKDTSEMKKSALRTPPSVPVDVIVGMNTKGFQKRLHQGKIEMDRRQRITSHNEGQGGMDGQPLPLSTQPSHSSPPSLEESLSSAREKIVSSVHPKQTVWKSAESSDVGVDRIEQPKQSGSASNGDKSTCPSERFVNDTDFRGGGAHRQDRIHGKNGDMDQRKNGGSSSASSSVSKTLKSRDVSENGGASGGGTVRGRESERCASLAAPDQKRRRKISETSSSEADDRELIGLPAAVMPSIRGAGVVSGDEQLGGSNSGSLHLSEKIRKENVNVSGEPTVGNSTQLNTSASFFSKATVTNPVTIENMTAPAGSRNCVSRGTNAGSDVGADLKAHTISSRVLNIGHHREGPSSTDRVAFNQSLENIKLKLFIASTKTHRGRGAERLFADYWDALGRYITCGFRDSTPAARASVENNGKNGIGAALKSFLTTRALRQIHNELILAIMKQSLKQKVSESKFRHHVPVQWSGNVKRISSSGFAIPRAPSRKLSAGSSLRNPLDVGIVSKKPHDSVQQFTNNESDTNRWQQDFGVDSGVWTRCGQEGVISPPPPVSGKLGASNTSFTKNHPLEAILPSERLPGALSISPQVRSVTQGEGMEVSDTAVWVLAIAVKEFTASVLKRTVSDVEAINAGELPPMLSASQSASGISKPTQPRQPAKQSTASNSSDVTSAYSLSRQAEVTTSKKRSLITSMGLAQVLSGNSCCMGGSPGGSLSRLAFERCVSAAGEKMLGKVPSGLGTLQTSISREIDSASAKRRRIAAGVTNPVLDTGVKISRSASGAPTSVSGPAHASVAVDHHMNPLTRDQTSADFVGNVTKRGRETHSPSATPQQVPQGMGRGAKDLSALKMRNTTSGNTPDDSPRSSAPQKNESNSALGVDTPNSPTLSRRGRGSGVKNLAAMRARTMTSQSVGDSSDSKEAGPVPAGQSCLSRPGSHPEQAASNMPAAMQREGRLSSSQPNSDVEQPSNLDEMDRKQRDRNALPPPAQNAVGSSTPHNTNEAKYQSLGAGRGMGGKQLMLLRRAEERRRSEGQSGPGNTLSTTPSATRRENGKSGSTLLSPLQVPGNSDETK